MSGGSHRRNDGPSPRLEDESATRLLLEFTRWLDIEGELAQPGLVTTYRTHEELVNAYIRYLEAKADGGVRTDGG